MHDAHEAYCGDVSTPAKQAIGPAWYDFEDRLEAITRAALRCHTASYTHRAAVKRADLIALATERQALLPHHGAGSVFWECLEGIQPVTWADLASDTHTSTPWHVWRDLWLMTYEGLQRERSALMGFADEVVPAL